MAMWEWGLYSRVRQVPMVYGLLLESVFLKWQAKVRKHYYC